MEASLRQGGPGDGGSGRRRRPRVAGRGVDGDSLDVADGGEIGIGRRAGVEARWNVDFVLNFDKSTIGPRQGGCRPG